MTFVTGRNKRLTRYCSDYTKATITRERGTVVRELASVHSEV